MVRTPLIAGPSGRLLISSNDHANLPSVKGSTGLRRELEMFAL